MLVAVSSWRRGSLKLASVRSGLMQAERGPIANVLVGTSYGAQGVKLWIFKLLDVNAFQFLRSSLTGPEQRVVV